MKYKIDPVSLIYEIIKCPNTVGVTYAESVTVKAIIVTIGGGDASIVVGKDMKMNLSVTSVILVMITMQTVSYVWIVYGRQVVRVMVLLVADVGISDVVFWLMSSINILYE